MNISGEGFEFVTSSVSDVAIADIVDAMIEIDEEGTALSDTVEGGKTIARASLTFDLRMLNSGMQVSDERGVVESILRIAIAKGMDEHLCQCLYRGDDLQHDHRFGPCGGHTRTLDAPRLCLDCA